jgi:hypothetical protein
MLYIGMHQPFGEFGWFGRFGSTLSVFIVALAGSWAVLYYLSSGPVEIK